MVTHPSTKQTGCKTLALCQTANCSCFLMIISWELLYADDLVVRDETEDDLIISGVLWKIEA